MVITSDGTEVPDELMIGVTRGQWPLQLLYNEQSAADWLADTGHYPGDRRVFRLRVEVIKELVYVPPVPAGLQARPVKAFGVKLDDHS